MRKIDIAEAELKCILIAVDYRNGWNDAVDAMHRWISVEERLPEKHIGVIACCEDRYIDLMTYDGRHWNWNGRHQDSVTHWMPLPELPEEEANES